MVVRLVECKMFETRTIFFKLVFGHQWPDKVPYCGVPDICIVSDSHVGDGMAEFVAPHVLWSCQWYDRCRTRFFFFKESKLSNPFD